MCFFGLTVTLPVYAAPGDLDSAFGANGKATISLGSAIHVPTGIASQADGKYLVSYDATGRQGSPAGGIARFNADHTPDLTWGFNGVVGAGNTYSGFFSGQSVSGMTVINGKVLVLENDGGLGNGGEGPSGQYQLSFVARYTTDGKPDTTFGSYLPGYTLPFPAGGGDFSQRYNAMAIAPDGKIIVAGESTGALLVVRFSADGILDTSFGVGGWTRTATGISGAAGVGVVVQPDGKIVVVGNSSVTHSAFVVRLDAAGVLDASFNSGGIYLLPTTAGPTDCRSVLLDGSRIVVGCTQTGGGTSDFLVLGLTTAGAIDAGFDNTLKDAGGTGDTLYGLLKHPDGRIFAAGRGGTGGNRIALLALNANGTLASNFATNGLYVAPETDSTEARAIGWNGTELLIAGMNTVSTNGDALLATFTPTGVRASLQYSNLSFSSGRYWRIKALPNGKILTAGTTILNGISNFVASRLNANGILDTSFGTAAHSTISTLDYEFWGLRDFALQTDGKIVMTGDFGRGNTATQSVGVARFLGNGGIDQTFNATGTPGQNFLAIPGSASDSDTGQLIAFPAAGHAVRVQTDGKILVAARMIPANLAHPGFQSIVVRFNADGTVDNGYGVGGVAKTNFNFTSQSRALDIDAAGRAVLAAVGSGGIQFARFDTNGVLDPSFGTGGMAAFALPSGYSIAGVPNKVFVLPGGKIVTIISAAQGNDGVVGVMRIEANGSLDSTFGDGGLSLVVAAPQRRNGAFVHDASIMPNGRIVLACSTLKDTLIETITTSAAVRFLANGMRDNDFGTGGIKYYPGLDGITGVDVQSDGSLLLSGGANVAGQNLGLVVKTVAEPSTGLNLLAVISGKTHGTAGTFHLPVAISPTLSGAITVEPRAIGNAHTLVFQFDGPINIVGGVSATDALGGSVGTATALPSGTDVVVTLIGVPDNKRATVSLTGLNGSGTASVSLGFLVGDVDSSRSIDQIDVSALKSHAGQFADKSNFKFDLNTSGAISAADVVAVKARRETVLQ